MRPEDVPDELAARLYNALTVCDGLEEAREALAAVLPFRDAQIERETRTKVAAEIRSIFVLARRDMSPGEAKAEAYETAARHITRGES